MGLSATDRDEKREWLFTRCIHCGGFAVLKQSRNVSMRIGESSTPRGSADQITGQNVAHIQVDSSKPKIKKQIRKTPTPPPFRHGPKAFVPAEPEPTQDLPKIALPTPLPQIALEQRPRNAIIQVAIGAAGAIALLSGLMLYQRGKELMSRKEAKRIEATIARKVEERKPRLESVTLSASSPETPPVELKPLKPSPSKEMYVEPVLRDVKLRSGPGLQYPVVGIAEMSEQYRVLGFRDRWFHVVPVVPSPTKPKHAWVRNDVIKSVQSARAAANAE